ncbi:2'-5' RNA ligase [Virgibacillus profundi]|uniref:2'-5' RNA ligase n=1 Tax=Virgibacillus profundi TaxID=2024555 RepID=A0A2A2IG28_9BACI|nr:RNA ligase family protein [Virgibacillus profundi]PAV30318.1 2'-5' RNA ligase [Virgibacillus profundi]PXY54490.1 2'-5' RNA ligase [Virgibacillus profundi]
MSYSGYVVKVKELRKHSNADRLQVLTVFGNDVIVGLNVEVGDVGIYFPTDGKLNYDFAKKNNLLREQDAEGNQVGGYLDPDKRHVSSIRLRGEKSDGLYMPISSLNNFCDVSKLNEGDKIDTINGKQVCEKYVPRGEVKNSNPTGKQTKKKEKESYPFFEQHVDTQQLAYNTNSFKEGDLCYITLKLHGTSQRTSHAIKKEVNPLHKFLRLFGVKKHKKDWEYVTGTRRVMLKDYNGGYYGGNAFRKQWHDFFVDKLPKGVSVYYEVVGYTGTGQLIMPEVNNKKTKDKEFIKKYGKTTKYTYGLEEGQSDIYVYRMTMTNEDGEVVEIPWETVKLYCEKMGVKYTPELDKFFFTTVEDMMERVGEYEDGIDPIGKTHIREGVVVRVENHERFTAYKQKNFSFKVLEGIVKQDDVLDMEEENSLEV